MYSLKIKDAKTEGGYVIGFFLILLFCTYCLPLEVSGEMTVGLKVEKSKYLLDEVLFYQVELKAPSNEPAYFQWISESPPLEVRDENNRLMQTATLDLEGIYPTQMVVGKQGKTTIHAEKLLPGESGYVIAGAPVELNRAVFKPGHYKVSYPVMTYNEIKGDYGFTYSESYEIEIVQPTGSNAFLSSEINSIVHPLSENQASKDAPRFRLKKLLEKYPGSPYVGTILYYLTGWDQNEKMLLDFIQNHPTSLAANYCVSLLSIRWIGKDYSLLDADKEPRKKLEALATRYKGTTVEQAVRHQITMFEKKRDFLLERKGLKGGAK